MNRKLLATVSAIWLSGSMIAAQAQTSADTAAGEVVTTTGDAGSTILIRGGETFSLAAGDQLFDGDRIVTRLGASVELQIDDCTRTLDEGLTIVIDDAFCEAVFASADETILAEAGLTQGTAPLLPVLGGAAVIGGGAAALAGGSPPPPPPPTSR